MAQLIVIIPLTLVLILWYRQLKTLITPSGIFFITWIGALTLQMLWAPAYFFSASAAAVIVALMLTFSAGELFSYTILGKYFKTTVVEYREQDKSAQERSLRYVILIMGTLSIFGSFLYFMFFVDHFGSVAGLLSAGWLIREAIGEGAINVPLYVRLMTLIAYSVISLAFIYNMCFKFRWFLMLPFISIFVMGIAQAARAGTFMILIWIFVAKILKDKLEKTSNVGLIILKRGMYFTGIFLVIFFAGLMYREQSLSFDLVDSHQFKIAKIYAFGAISAFSVFWDNYNFSSEPTFGLYSFASLFEILRIKKLAFGFYDEYLYISEFHDDYTNVFTLFRSLIEDFRLYGALIYMFMLGLLCGLAYKGSLCKNLASISFLSIMYTMLIYSVIAPLTQHNSILLAMLLPPILIKFLGIKYFAPASTDEHAVKPVLGEL